MEWPFSKRTHARYGLLQVKKVYFWGGTAAAVNDNDDANLQFSTFNLQFVESL